MSSTCTINIPISLSNSYTTKNIFFYHKFYLNNFYILINFSLYVSILINIIIKVYITLTLSVITNLIRINKF